MKSTLIAVDVAKLVFEIGESDAFGRIARRLRLNRTQFTEYVARYDKAEFVLEACGGAHYWAWQMIVAGHTVRLLPGQYARAYRQRNKTDQAAA